MGKRTWVLWSSVVLASTLLGLLFAASQARSVARADRQRRIWESRIFVVEGSLDAPGAASQSALIKTLERSEKLSTRQLPQENRPEVFRQIVDPGFLPPNAGQRNLLDPIDAQNLPRALRDSLERLESAQHVEVTWNEPTAKATMQQAEDSFRLTTVSLTNPQAPANVVTVVNSVAYIEDHGEDFSRPVARFQLPVDRNFVLSVNNLWWKALATSYRNRNFQISAIPGGAAIADTKAFTNHVPIRYTVADGSHLTSFETTSLQNQTSKVTYEFAPSVRWKSIDAPTWAATSIRIPMTWDEALPPGKPDWTEPVVLVTQVRHSSRSVGSSQCGSPPFTPDPFPSEVPTLPVGAAFRCQINLADVPSTIGLPVRGLLQFFTVNEYESGFVRYFPEITASTHNNTRALNISIDEAIQPTSLTFTSAETANGSQAVRNNAPRTRRFLRHPNGFPLANWLESDPDLVGALAKRGVNYAANDVDMMGGQWGANGATPEGYTRLFMISDDVGYAYWHIPTADLATARFDRVVGGWTD
jgi:Domain of unknown function (DUF1963)